MGTEASQIVDQIEQGSVQPLQPAESKAPDTQQTAPQAKPEDRVSSRIDTYIRKEQEHRKRDALLKQREQELEERFKRVEEFEAAKSGKDYKKSLQLLGMDYDQLTQTILNDGAPPAEVQLKKLEEKFDSFRSAQEQAEQERAKQADENRKRNLDNAINGAKKEINQYLDDNKERYEYTTFEGAQELVFEVMDEHYNRTQRLHAEELAKLGEDINQAVGKVLSVSEAADLVEKHMEQKYHKAKELNKTKTLWGAVPQGLVKEAVKQELKPQMKQATLTNNMSASQTVPRKSPLTDDERIQKAIAYAKSIRPNI